MARLRARFHAEPIVQAHRAAAAGAHAARRVGEPSARRGGDLGRAHQRHRGSAVLRQLQTPHDATPQTHLLSNGRYAVMLTAAGSGYSRWGDLALTRWSEDATCDACGSYFYLRDVDSGRVWSAGYQPSGVEADRYEVTFTEDRAEFVRVDGTITTTLEVLVSPEDDAEVRRISLTNNGNRGARDRSHLLRRTGAGAARRRPGPSGVLEDVRADRISSTRPGALLATGAGVRPPSRRSGPRSTRSSKATPSGGRNTRPTARASSVAAAGCASRSRCSTVGGCPIPWARCSIPSSRCAIECAYLPGGTVRIAVWTFVADSRGNVLQMLDKHQDSNAFVRAGTLAWTQGQVQLRHLGIDAAEASLFQRLAGHVLYANAAMRPAGATIRRGAAGPGGAVGPRHLG